MKKIAGICLLFVMTQSCTQNEKITLEEVNKVLQRFDEGWKNKNAGIVDSVLAEKYVYYTQSGGVFDRANVVQTAGSVQYKLIEMNRQQISVSISGNTAVVNTTWHGKGSYYDQPFDDTQRCSVTIVKHKGKVSILSEHCTLLN